MTLRDTMELTPAANALLAKHGIKGMRNGSLSLPQLTDLAHKMGARIENTDLGRVARECEVIAPHAHNWGDAGNEHHVLLAVAEEDTVPYRPSYNDIANRMIDGIIHCQPGCDCGWDLVDSEAA